MPPNNPVRILRRPANQQGRWLIITTALVATGIAAWALRGLSAGERPGLSRVAADAVPVGAPLPDEGDTGSTAGDDGTSADEASSPNYRSERIRGQVVWLAPALEDDFGISTVPEVSENGLALRTHDGRLFPIVENVRGRAFRKDPRLRDTDVELLVRRYDRQPFVQILQVCVVEDGRLYEVDYWCDVCAIVMFEKGPCACCQDDNRLRKRPLGATDRE